MNNSRLTFNTSTNIKLPIGVYRILQRDAYYYGFIKNKKPNINGFLNRLVPALSDYYDDLFNEILKYNCGNLDIAKACARSIHNVYLHPFVFHDDGTVNVPFRISKNSYNDFITIHDEKLAFYDTDFTNYVRTLLSEYASRTLGQREYMYAFREIRLLRREIRKSGMCKFYTNGEIIAFAPISIEPSPIYNHNYIVGIDKSSQPHALRLSEIEKISVLGDRVKVTEEMCESVMEYIEKIYEEEYNECLN